MLLPSTLALQDAVVDYSVVVFFLNMAVKLDFALHQTSMEGRKDQREELPPAGPQPPPPPPPPITAPWAFAGDSGMLILIQFLSHAIVFSICYPVHRFGLGLQQNADVYRPLLLQKHSRSWDTRRRRSRTARSGQPCSSHKEAMLLPHRHRMRQHPMPKLLHPQVVPLDRSCFLLNAVAHP